MIAIFLFYDYAQGKQSKYALSKEFKHVNVIVNNGDGWVLFDYHAIDGINYRILKVKDGARLIKNLTVIKPLVAMVTVWVEERKTGAWKIVLMRTCNEISRYLTGVNTGLTLNPKHLYKKLLKFNGLKNFEILQTWRRTSCHQVADTEQTL